MRGWILRKPEKMDNEAIQRIIALANSQGIQLEGVDPTLIRVFCGGEFDGRVYVGEELREVPDFAVAAFFTEKGYQTMAAVKMLEGAGVLCVNTYECFQNVDDKLLTVQKLSQALPQLLQPRTMLLTPEISAAFISQHFTYPLVMKVMHGSKGRGVVLVHSEKELEGLLDLYGASSYGDQVLIQEFIATSKGRDLRLIICDGKFDKALVRSNEQSFRSNTAGGGSITPYDAPPELAALGEQIAQVLQINIGSVDFLFGPGDTYYFCEANGMIGLSFDIKHEVLSLVEQVRRRPVPAWKKRRQEEQ